jgi:hypothetical protein
LLFFVARDLELIANQLMAKLQSRGSSRSVSSGVPRGADAPLRAFQKTFAIHASTICSSEKQF